MRKKVVQKLLYKYHFSFCCHVGSSTGREIGRWRIIHDRSILGFDRIVLVYFDKKKSNYLYKME
jgi:hypothetical protein